jgi:signal transduction histidine kinase
MFLRLTPLSDVSEMISGSYELLLVALSFAIGIAVLLIFIIALVSLLFYRRYRAQLVLQQALQESAEREKALSLAIQKMRQTEALLKLQKEQLEEALRELKQAETQLIQNEKMVALGQLVAGIAHEINNPVSFLFGNLEYTGQYIEDLLNLIRIYHREYPDSISKFTENFHDLDLELISKDLQTSVSAMQRGVQRIWQLVLALRNFSRLDESEIKLVDIHEGINSTLLLLQHQLKATESRREITVIKNYGKLPYITCYPSQLNQVFMHLLNNAIDAFEREQNNVKNFFQPNPQICISTEMTTDNTVKIRIADNGCGISDAMRSRLFDPFFTTKPVGKGTGLGLSISYQIIVQQHKGKLTYSSLLGQGTVFTIEIPMHNPVVNQSLVHEAGTILNT